MENRYGGEWSLARGWSSTANPTWVLLFMVAAFCFWCAGTAVASDDDETNRHIRQIVVIRDDVFAATGDDLKRYQSLMNGLHVETREVVVRAELLFSEGELLDLDLLEATERNLRGLDFFSRVEIHFEEVGPDSADIVVATQDQWSTIPNIVIASGGGLTQIGGALEEVNLFGLGKRLYLEGVYENDVGTSWSFGYDDPQFLGKNLNAGLVWATGPLIDGYTLYLNRPFFSIDTKWSWGVNGHSTEEIERLFSGGEEISRYRFDSDKVSIHATRAWGNRFRKWKLGLSYRYHDRNFSPIPDQTHLPIAEDEVIYATTVSVSGQRISHIKTTGINKFVRTEDFVMGRSGNISLGRAGFPVAKGVKRWELNLGFRESHVIGTHQLLFTNVGFSTLFERDTIGRINARYYNKFWIQTLALNLEVKLADKLEFSRQFVLGAESGLRGYPAREFTGDKRILMNLESRLFPPWEVITIRIGGIVFFDGGNVWKRGQAIDLRDMNYSAGVGARFGFVKIAGATVGRIDVGWPLNREGGAVFTLGAEQHF